ncbi:MAG TPA: hypothetical protein VHB98_17150 [Chloroflexota bacterium]|nr:hypothetical protein [Chloroflexota bacterium]
MLSLAAGWSIQSRAGPGPVYSLTQVNMRLADNPRVWRGRQVRVWAIGGGCIPWAAPEDPQCVGEGPELVQMRADTLVTVLPLICGQHPPLPRFVRTLPWLGRLLPAPQVLNPGTPAVYRIQLPTDATDEAQLLDSVPNCGPS